MPKKIMETREDLRSAMIDAAERIIIAEGVEALTARKLAGELGIAVGTTYNVFKQMDDLISEVSTRTLIALSRELEGVDVTSDDPEAVLMAFADAYISFVTGNRQRWAALFSGSLNPESVPQQRNTQLVNRLFETAEQALLPLYAVDKGEDVAKSARALWAALHGMLSLTAAGRAETLGLGDVRETIRLLIHYHIIGLHNQL